MSDQFPIERLSLPEYVPDVEAGHPSPKKVGHWKIQAIKVCIWVRKNKIITRKQFSQFRMSTSRWLDGYWMKKGYKRGQWIEGPYFPLEDFKKQHQKLFSKIEDDYEEWSEKITLEGCQ